MDIVKEARKIHREKKTQVLEGLITDDEEEHITITIDIKIPKKGIHKINKIIDLTK